MTGEAAMAHPAEHIPADEPPRQRQGGFRIGAARLGMRGAPEGRAVGQLAHHLHRPLQRKNAVPTVIADVQSRPTNSTNVVFHFQNHTRELSVFRPAVTHRSPPWPRSTASCNYALVWPKRPTTALAFYRTVENYRIQSAQFHACVLGRKLPMGFGVPLVPFAVPCLHLVDACGFRRDTAPQAVPTPMAACDLCHV